MMKKLLMTALVGITLQGCSVKFEHRINGAQVSDKAQMAAMICGGGVTVEDGVLRTPLTDLAASNQLSSEQQLKLMQSYHDCIDALETQGFFDRDTVSLTEKGPGA